jgi:4-amino-4-deoxy-L-arabinose transferase-like glycosyltransferase
MRSSTIYSLLTPTYPALTRLTFWFTTAFLLVLAVKITLAALLDLYSDEIFYWQASTRPALAYSDLPFMSALLAGAGVELFGNKAIAVRSLFLIAGTSIPFLIFWLARPLVPRVQALEAALFSLCLPLTAFLGLLAVPDVPMIFFGLLLIGLFERATRLNTLGLWIGVGVVAALGMSTHYRFSLYLLAGLIYLLVTPGQRQYLREAKLWFAVAVMSIGLLPAIIFNLRNELSGLDYHLLDRHPWQFQLEGLLHPLKQALLVTPPLYAALLVTLYMALKRSRTGDHRAGLFAVFALVHLSVYMVLAPWTDSTRTSIHWPLSGYLPLLVYLPQTLRDVYVRMLNVMSYQAVRRSLRLIPILGFTGTLIAFIGVGSQAFNKQLQPLLGTGILSNKMAGWEELNEHLSHLLADGTDNSDMLIVTDNYYTAAQIEFGVGRAFDVFNIDNDKAVRDGRIAQYQLWQNNEYGLLSHAGRDALFITEDSTLTIDDKLEVITRACSIFQRLMFINQLTLFSGDKSFSFYHGKHVNDAPVREAGLQGNQNLCPLPSQAWLDQPIAGGELTGTVKVAGWAINDGGGIRSIQLLANGTVIMELQRTIPRVDVIEIFKVEHDPDQPLVGFTGDLDTSLLPNGLVDLVLEITANSGEIQRFRETAVRIKNAGVQPANQ